VRLHKQATEKRLGAYVEQRSKTEELDERAAKTEAEISSLSAFVQTLSEAHRQISAYNRISVRQHQELVEKVDGEAEALNSLSSAVAAFAKSSSTQIIQLKNALAAQERPAPSKTVAKAPRAQPKGRFVPMDEIPFFGSAIPFVHEVKHDEKMIFGFGMPMQRAVGSVGSTTSRSASLLLDGPIPRIQNFGKALLPMRQHSLKTMTVTLKHAMTVQEGSPDKFVIHLNKASALTTSQKMVIHPNETIGMLKQAVMKIMPEAGDNFELYYAGRQLETSKTVQFYDIEESSDLLLAIIV